MAQIKYLAFNEIASLDVAGLPEDDQQGLFRFKADLFDKFHSVSALQRGSAVPYISLHSVNSKGEVIQDLNVDFFFKTIDYANMSQGNRYGERPVMSIKSVELKTSQPPGSGYLYFTEVALDLKIHSPTALNDAQVMSLILPGMSHRLVYGWNSVGPNGNEFLNEKQELTFQVTTYDLNYDETGQVELLVRGMALNDEFNNTLVGDTGQTLRNDLVSDRGADGIARKKERNRVFEDHIENLKDTAGGPISAELIQEIALDYNSREKEARGKITAEIKTRRKTLEDTASDGNFTFHDVVRIMLGPTLEALSSDVWPDVDEFRIVYGDVNEKAQGGGIPNSLAEFPINVERFKSQVNDATRRGVFAFTVKQFLNMLVNNFLENDQLWDENRNQGSDPENPPPFNKPEIVVFFNNRVGDKGGRIMELLIHDVNFGLPVTTEAVTSGKVSEGERERLILGESGLLPLRLGHAQSFVKKVSLTQVRDNAMKTAMIVSMFQDRQDGPRSSKLPSQANKSIATNPLRLPVQGTIDVLGHVRWKPFKAFYLDAGTPLVTGVYKIMAVKSKLSADGFNTVLDIFPN